MTKETRLRFAKIGGEPRVQIPGPRPSSRRKERGKRTAVQSSKPKSVPNYRFKENQLKTPRGTRAVAGDGEEGNAFTQILKEDVHQSMNRDTPFSARRGEKNFYRSRYPMLGGGNAYEKRT